jgi:hypothetical protein
MAGKKRKAGARKKAPTPDQRRARSDMRTLSTAWNELQDEQREAWELKARKNRRGGLAARRRRRSGRRLFFKVNFHRLALQQGLLADPPESGTFAAVPLVQLVITNHAGRIVLKLRVSGAPTEGVVVSASRPENAGVMVCRRCVRIGPLPPPKRGMCNITKAYEDKYGVPPVGKKIFVRIQQMSDYLGSLAYTTSAIVPDEEGWNG